MTVRCVQEINDLKLMQVFAQLHQGENLHVIDLPYRFSSWVFTDMGVSKRLCVSDAHKTSATSEISEVR